MSRSQWGLQDCNVGTPNLCQQGANYIRQYRSQIISNYQSQSNQIAQLIGKNTETIWLIEPDFYQYYGDNNQNNGKLSGTYMRQLFDDISAAIKSGLPNARISWDISPWLTNSQMQTWWGYFATSSNINYIHTSGGESQPSSQQITRNGVTWLFMNSLTGKKIIADTGYGVGGGSTGHNSGYDDINNLKARILNGVISVSQVNADSSWASKLNSLRASLPRVC